MELCKQDMRRAREKRLRDSRSTGNQAATLTNETSDENVPYITRLGPSLSPAALLIQSEEAGLSTQSRETSLRADGTLACRDDGRSGVSQPRR